MANLESAFAGESMAHVKYRYFAKLAGVEEHHANHYQTQLVRVTTPAAA